MFNHHVYIDNGLVAESNLPTGVSYAPVTPRSQTVITPLPTSGELDSLADDDGGTSTSKVPVALPIIAD